MCIFPPSSKHASRSRHRLLTSASPAHRDDSRASPAPAVGRSLPRRRSSCCSRRPRILLRRRSPPKLSDTTFWRLVTDFSESNGYFRSDNFVSNETTYQWVIPELLRTTKPGGVYLGVGPDQNFTLSRSPQAEDRLHLRHPSTEHVDAPHVQGADRAVDRPRRLRRAVVFPAQTSRPRHASTPEAIFLAYATVPPDSAAYRKNLTAIDDRLVTQHGFKLSDDDLATIKYVYDAFVQAGPDITYNFSQGRGAFGRGRMPTYAELQVATDSDRVHRGYLATEANFRLLKDLETNNLVVPLVGDFAGPKAIRAVGAYVKEHGATVTAFYLSNVEQYLFMGEDDWRRFYANAGTLPIDATSTFIRSAFNGMGYYRYPGGGMRAQQLLASMLEQLKRFNEGTLASYDDVLRTSR